jgi:hypothetical protein
MAKKRVFGTQIAPCVEISVLQNMALKISAIKISSKFLDQNLKDWFSNCP